MDTEPRYDDIEIQPGYFDTDIHQRDGKSGYGNVDSKSLFQYGHVTDFKTDQVDADVDHKQTDNKESIYSYY